MTLLDLMNVYRIKQNNDNVYALLLEMFEAGNVDNRIDRNVLAQRMLMDCGRREPRYNTTDTFLFFGSVWLESKKENIAKTLDLLALNYNPLNEYEERRNEDIARAHQSDGVETKARDTETTNTTSQTDTDAKTTATTDEHFVSAENETAAQLRTRDTINETIGDTATISATETEIVDEDTNTTKSNTTTHNDNISTTISGHKKPQAELIRAELEKAKLNIYDSIIEDFADIMFINVF